MYLQTGTRLSKLLNQGEQVSTVFGTSRFWRVMFA